MLLFWRAAVYKMLCSVEKYKMKLLHLRRISRRPDEYIQ